MCKQRSRRQCRFKRKRRNGSELRTASHSLHARRMQWVNHNSEIGFLGGAIELMHPRIAERDTIDVGTDFDAAKAKRLDAGEPARGKGGILHRSHAYAEEALRMCRAELRDGAIDMIGQYVGI